MHQYEMSYGNVYYLLDALRRWDKLISEEKLKLKQLQDLSMWRAKNIRLPEQMRELTSLEELSLGEIQLTSLPEWIGELKQLTYLDLSNNQLEKLPDSMRRLKNLQKLYLNHNKLASLPESMGELKNLTELNLEHNQLISVPLSLCELLHKNNAKINLQGNNLFNPIRGTNYIYNYYRLNDTYLYLPYGYSNAIIIDDTIVGRDKKYIIHKKTGIDEQKLTGIDLKLALDAVTTCNPAIIEKLVEKQPEYQPILKYIQQQNEIKVNDGCNIII